ncbi:hypothetical protein HER39_20170, partial [Arthrobacter deserti]|nr:hypothetical protein [Arthrobacter deserti]
TLKVRYSAGVRIGEPEARQILSRVQELAAGTPRPVLVELAGLGSVASSAMTLFANRLPASCMALVGMSPVDVAVAKFFNTVHRPPYPVEYFSSYPHALAWLGRGPQNAGHGDPGRPGLPHASAPHPGHPARATAAAPGPERDTSLSCQTAGPEQPARQARLRQKLARVFAPGAVPDAAGRPHAGTGAAGPGPEQPARPVAADTLRQVTEAYHGKTRSKSFPKATAVAGAL